jgi:hypothetical protein
MPKDTPSTSTFRICVAILLAIQAACWALIMLDLFRPGKSLALLRHSADIFSNSTAMVYQVFERKGMGRGGMPVLGLREGMTNGFGIGFGG